MSDSKIDSISRERKKDQLRQQMLSVQNRSPDKKGNDSEAIVEKARLKVFRKRLIWIISIMVLLLAAGFGYWQYQSRHQFSEYKVNWEISPKVGSYVGYEYFGSNVLRYTKDGASYIDSQGKIVWTESYGMKAPVVSVRGDFAAIADQRGNSIYICNKDGVQGIATTERPISKIAVAGNGVVVAVIEESSVSYIKFYNRDGRALDVWIKSAMGGDGYPVDISLSQDATQLMCSYVYLSGGEMKSRVVFYDFSEIGKNNQNRLVGGFDEIFGGTQIAARVQYLGEPYSCAFTGSGPVFFSSKNLASPELLKEVPIEEEIRTIFYSDEYVGMIVKTGNGENPSRMEIFRNDGEPVLSKEFDYDYRYADIDGDLIFLYNEDSCQVYNLAGVMKLDAAFDFSVSRIRKGKLPNTIIVAGPQNMKEIKMQ